VRGVDRLKVMTFNILVGGEERFGAILDILAARRPDLLILEECVGWEDGERLGRVAGVLGIPATARHLYLGRARPRPSGARYPVAVVSRRPLALARSYNDPSFFGHGLVECAIAAGGEVLTLFGAHFEPKRESLRFVEARYLRSLLDPAAFARGRYLLAGDLNALSLRDPYPAELAERVRAAGVDKYGHPPRFETIEEIEGFGWVDLLRQRPLSAAWVTAPRDRGGVRIDYRTDYLFASPPLAERHIGAEVIEVGGASDHHAVEATFEL
jgi:exodeoxyribonuclease-3